MAREWRVDRAGDDEARSDERWLITYADMITVLLIFFITMYALSSRISRDNFDKMAQSLKNQLVKKKVQEKAIFSPFPTDSDLLKGEVAKEVRRAIVPLQGKSQVSVDLIEQGVLISLADTSFFDTGSTTLKEDGKEALLTIARAIATSSDAISIQGHTDSVRNVGQAVNANWIIAATRAANVVNYLSTVGGIPASRFQLISYGEIRPLYANDTPEHRAMNRRVDIVVKPKIIKSSPTPAPAPSQETLAPAYTPGPSVPVFGGNSGAAVPNPFGNSF